MKDMSTPHKVVPDAARKKTGLLAKPSRADAEPKEKSAIEHVKNLTTKLADTQMLADARLQEIIILSKLVLDLREEIQSRPQLQSAKLERSHKRRFWGIPSYLLGKNTSKLKKDLATLRNSALFDQLWYLKKYPDVQKSGVDPVLHYLKFGAKEGRDPGPRFNTLEYTRKNPELANSGENPLLHYIKKNG
ncbi:hypothetical protein BOTU111921_24135 [Bordetella tumbae]|uniref:hypothetical protein n=1 Tax=Bordetella tumbae TaxID=1649139 RepID=UPI0039EFD8A1